MTIDTKGVLPYGIWLHIENLEASVNGLLEQNNQTGNRKELSEQQLFILSAVMYGRKLVGNYFPRKIPVPGPYDGSTEELFSFFDKQEDGSLVLVAENIPFFIGKRN